MFMAIVPGDITTNGATLAGMSGVNIDHGNTIFGGLVFDKVAKLPKSPGMLNLPLFPGNPNTVTDILQVFHNNYVTKLTGLNNRLRNPVVKVAHPSLLFARQPFQEAFCPLRAFGLQRLPQFRIMLPDVHGLPPGKLQAVGGGGKVIDAAINADNVAVFRRKWDFAVDYDMDIKLFGAFVIAECCRRRFLSSKKTTLEITNIKFKFNPAVDGGNRNFFPLLDKREGAGIKAHTGRFELPGLTKFALFLAGFSNTGNCPDN